MLRHYETTLILDAELPDESVEEFVGRTTEIIQNNQGEMLHRENWGRRRLAYEINKQRRGNYVFIAYKAAPTVVRAVEKAFRVADEVIKFLTVKLEAGAVAALEGRIAAQATKSAEESAAPADAAPVKAEAPAETAQEA